MIKVSYNELFSTLKKVLIHFGFSEDDAITCSKIFSENTLVGVSSHGVNRFRSFTSLIDSGHIKPSAKPSKENSFNAFEQWNGNYGPGPLNAKLMTDRGIELAENFGIGCVSLKNSNHWMRPGYYAWEAADKGFVFICWTNTIPIMPPWGAKESTIGNNPIVFGVPRKEGNIILDIALSQYSYGKLANYAREGKELPYLGGYDSNGMLSKDAKEIYKTHRPLPIGYWKGSGMAFLLDLIATILSGGNSTTDLGKKNIDSGMSQIFIAIDPNKFSTSEIIENAVEDALNYYLSAEKIGDEDLSYPGERIAKTKQTNLLEGIPIDEKIWSDILNLIR